MSGTNPIFDETIPLNCTIIAEILGLFLKCNPVISYVPLPEFRLAQLNYFAKTLSGKREISEPNIFEAIGALYVLCAYYGGTGNYNSETSLLRDLSTIQTIFTECVMSMKWIGEVQITHPNDRILNLKLLGEKIKQFQLTTFVSANELIKDIIRDVVRQIRLCREKGTIKTKTKQPIDCLLTHSMYIMCAYSLAHTAAIRYHRGELEISPGLYEALICVVHIDGIRNSYMVQLFDRLRKSKKQGFNDVDRYDECMRLSRHLAFVVLRNIDITSINKLRLFRGRLNRDRNSTPKIDFAKLKSHIIGTQLLQIPVIKAPIQSNSSSEIALRLLSIENNRADMNNSDEVQRSERSISLGPGILDIGIQPPESLILSLNDSHTDETAPLTIEEREFSSLVDQDTEEELGSGNIKEFKDITEIMKLPIQLRPYYLISRPLREFPGENSTQDFTEVGVMKESQNCSASELMMRRMKKAYEESYKRPLPRYLNPEEGLYWLCDFYINHIYEQVSSGNMFLEKNQAHLHSLQLKLRNQVSEIRKSRQEGTRILPNTSQQQIKSRLHLIERLNLAREEALLERKIDALKNETLIHRRTQLESRANQILGTTKFAVDQGSIPSKDLNYGRSIQQSTIWTGAPELEDEHELRKKRERNESEKRQRVQNEQNFGSIPRVFGLDYAKSIKAQQEERVRIEEQFRQELKDLQEIEIGRLRAKQQADIKLQRDAVKKEINDSLDYKKYLDDQKKEIRKKRIADRKLEEKRRIEMEELEAEKIRDLKSWTKYREEREERLKTERHLMERVRLKNMASAKEYEEILKSHKEEMRMKYLEELQRTKEQKRFEAERKRHTELIEKQRKAKQEKEIILARIRKGNFMYHQGKLGYYDNIRDDQLPYIQYEDEDGYPYYFDPITLKTEYSIPQGAPVIHHLEKEKQDYDRLYGAGEYEKLQAEKKWKEQCNIDGGYWEDGVWIPLKGYYDENFQFVSFY